MPLLLTEWHVANDKFGRRIILIQEGDQYSIEIEPSSQRDEGERIHYLNKTAIIEMASVVKDQRP